MKLRFRWSEIEKALKEVRTAATARPLYGKDTGKGLWLVGDQGVYFMPNTTDGTRHKADDTTLLPSVVYALECNPKTLPFDTWWGNKQASFGGDDGVEFFSLDIFEKLAAAKPTYLVLTFTRNKISLTAE